MSDQYTRHVEPALLERNGNAHLSIAGFAPIPMLMKLGALVGDKTRAHVLDLSNEGWLWDTRDTCPEPKFTYNVPTSLPREVSVVVSISGKVMNPAGRDVVEFAAEAHRCEAAAFREAGRAGRRRAQTCWSALVRAKVVSNVLGTDGHGMGTVPIRAQRKRA